MSGEAMTSLELQEAAMPSGAGPAEVAAAEEPAAKGEAVEQAPPKEGGTGKEEVTTRERFLELWSGFQVAHGDDTKVGCTVGSWPWVLCQLQKWNSGEANQQFDCSVGQQA